MARAYVESRLVVGDGRPVPVEVYDGRGPIAPVVPDVVVTNEPRVHRRDRGEKPSRVVAVAEIGDCQRRRIGNRQSAGRGIHEPVLGDPGPEFDAVMRRACGERGSSRGLCHVSSHPGASIRRWILRRRGPGVLGLHPRAAGTREQDRNDGK